MTTPWQHTLLIAGPAFMVVILLLGLFAAVWAERHRDRYSNTETRALEYVADKLGRIREDAQTSDGEPDATKVRVRQLVDIDTLTEGLSKETIIWDRLSLIRTMRMSQVKVSLDALQHMTLARESSAQWLSFPAFAANMSMMLGLLGTVTGLLIMVQQIGSAVPADLNQVTMDSWTASVNQIRGVLGGMKTGFFATLAGLVASIAVSWLNFRLGHSQARFLDRLDRFTTSELLPATVPATEDESLLEKVSIKLEDSFGMLDSIARNNQESLEELSAIEKGFIEIIDAVRQSTKTEASERIQTVVGRLAGVIDQMGALSHSVVNLTESLPNFLRQSEQNAIAGLTRVDRLIKVYERERAVGAWPIQTRVVCGLLAAFNMALVVYIIAR
ncbi:MAG: putative rane protein [Gemmatimonadetes bacterium]|nr:putative rane protein [Gemmatimonadota bacterium]